MPPASIPPSLDGFPIKISSSSLSASQQGAEPTRDLVQGSIFEGARTRAHQNGEGSFSPYWEGTACAKRTREIYKAMEERHTNGRWIDYPQPPRLDAVRDWWLDLQDKSFSTERGLYYTSSTSNDDASTSQINLFVKPNNAELPRTVHDWKDVEVIGLLKESNDDRKATLRQISSYVSHAFANQPSRRSVHTFALCGDEMRIWAFDRSGPYSSTAFNIH